MSRFATIDKEKPMSAVLKVVGVGGGGCNAIESMIARGLSGVEYIAVNTDSQVLRSSTATHKVQCGGSITRGLGAGADPNIGRKSAEEDREQLAEVLSGSDMVFITAGMGGGTGTGAAPVIASIAKIMELRQHVDSLIVIPNERLLNILDKATNAFAAFDKPNEVLYEATRGIADIITIEGLINVDFADVRAVMNSSGEALMGCGIASGENRAIEAAQKAISSPLLEGVNIKGAKSVLVNVTGSSSMTMQEIDEGNNIIFEAAGEEANVIFGVVKKEEMNDYISYTVIATGFDSARGNSYSSKSNTIKKQTPSLTENIRGGFNLFQQDNVDSADLDVPTIIRMKSPKTPIEDDEEKNTPSGFAVENSRYSWAKERNEKKDDSNDDDSSSFLRMIMD